MTGRPARWTNWAQTVTCRPSAVAAPADVAEVVDLLAAAGRAGRRVKPVGSGHSFTPIAATDGVQVHVDRLTGLRATAVDPQSGAGTVTVAAGTSLHVLNSMLAELGLGLAAMGDIDAQSVAGAIATGTHGSGRDNAGLAALVAGLEIALPDGSLVQCSAAQEPDLFQAGRLGLGALGIVTAVTLRVEPAFCLHAVEERGRLDDLLARFDELASAEHLEVYWLPFTDALQVKRYQRTDEPLRPGSRRPAWRTDLVENLGLGLIQRITRAAPRFTPLLNRIGAGLILHREYVDAAPAVLTSTRRVRFHEMEYALPRRVAVAALHEFRRLTAGGPWRIAFPVQLRLAPADDVWLSTAYERETLYVACHAYPRTDYRSWFAAVEELFASYGGRPHWGKLHSRDAASLAGVCPRLGDFRRVRDCVDPSRMMANDYLRRVLGD